MKRINILLNLDEKFEPKARYVFRILAKISGYTPVFYKRLTSEDIHVYYGLKTDEKYPVKIYRGIQTAIFFNKKDTYPEEQFNSVKYRDEYIPFLFSPTGEIYQKNRFDICIRKDIISSAFYFLSCWQEYSAFEKGAKKFNYRDSLQYKFNFTDLPVVERYADILTNVLKIAFPAFSPQRKITNKFCVSLSHDIDYWEFWDKNDIRKKSKRYISQLKKNKIGILSKIIAHNLHKKLFYSRTYQMRKILTLEHKLKAKSSFFLLTKNDFPFQKLNYFSNPAYKQEIRTLLTNQSVNLQGSLETSSNFDELQNQLARLNEFDSLGFRIRYYKANFQQLFPLLEKLKIKFDSSIGFDGVFGYRAGISYPFHPYNIIENRPFEFISVPVIISSRAFFTNNEYQKIILKTQMREILKKTAKYGGHISLNWQTHVFDPIEFPFLNKIYWKIIKKSVAQRALILSTESIAKIWNNSF